MSTVSRRSLLTASLATAPLLALNERAHAAQQPSQALERKEGLSFRAAVGPRTVAIRDMHRLFQEMRIPEYLVTLQMDERAGEVTFTLSTPPGDTSTLDFSHRPELWVYDQVVHMPAAGGGVRAMATVSEKEVLLSLLQRGRHTVFEGGQANVAALREHMRLRQHIVAWGQELSWGWPDGGSAYWNKRYWDRGTPHNRALTHAALVDTLVAQKRYGIGCYTAAKMVYAGAILDFYARVQKDPAKAKRILDALWSDADPLVGVEPGAMWAFEPGHTPQEDARPGKLLGLAYEVSARNFVPGDWVYFWNTDAVTYEKTGYEGSNCVYLGRGRFSDYYNDNEHGYSYEQKLDDVYQWRHGVFSRSRDYLKARRLTHAEREQLGNAPSTGGLLLPYRAVPRNAELLA